MPLMLYRLTHDQNNGLIHTSMLGRAESQIFNQVNLTTVQHVPPMVCRLTFSLGTSTAAIVLLWILISKGWISPKQSTSTARCELPEPGSFASCRDISEEGSRSCFSHPQEHTDPALLTHLSLCPALLCFASVCAPCGLSRAAPQLWDHTALPLLPRQTYTQDF